MASSTVDGSQAQTKDALDAQITEAVKYTICYYTGCVSGLGTAGSDLDVTHDISARVMLLVQNSESAMSKYCCVAQDVLAVHAWIEWFNEQHERQQAGNVSVTNSSAKPVWFYYFYTMGFMNGASLAAKIATISEDRQHEYVGAAMLAETQDRAMKRIFELQFS